LCCRKSPAGGIIHANYQYAAATIRVRVYLKPRGHRLRNRTAPEKRIPRIGNASVPFLLYSESDNSANHDIKRGYKRLRSRIVTFVIIMQSMLFLGHWFLYETWIRFWGMPQRGDSHRLLALQIIMAALSVSFVTASLLAFRYAHILVRLYYTCAAVWLGMLNYFFFAACAAWIVLGASGLAGLHWQRREMADVLFGLALLSSLYGIVNAASTRVTRITVRLANLPEAWRGRLAALVSDLHLGHVRNHSFVKRIVRMLANEGPNIVFIDGDLFDGTKANIDRLAQPWSQLHLPLGTYFVTGNHEEFFDRTKYLDALKRVGIRVLNNEVITLDGLQIVGMHYRESANPHLFRSILKQATLDPTRASILLTHAPDRPAIAEEEGISLQLSGHTHGGQFLPYTWIASRAYGRLVHGLNRLGKMWVFTTWGAGTWGPPLRIATKPEIVLIRFESAD
jgi:predicted MPP superfamily phosphohydrolase